MSADATVARTSVAADAPMARGAVAAAAADAVATAGRAAAVAVAVAGRAAAVAVAVAGAGRVTVLRLGARVPVVIVVQQHHLLVLVRALVVPSALAVAVVVVIIVLAAVVLQLFQLVRVCCPYELTVHVEDLSLRIHQKFTIVTFNLNTAHNNIILHIDADLLICRAAAIIICLSRLSVKAVTVFYQAVIV